MFACSSRNNMDPIEAGWATQRGRSDFLRLNKMGASSESPKKLKGRKMKHLKSNSFSSQWPLIRQFPYSAARYHCPRCNKGFEDVVLMERHAGKHPKESHSERKSRHWKLRGLHKWDTSNWQLGYDHISTSQRTTYQTLSQK